MCLREEEKKKKGTHKFMKGHDREKKRMATGVGSVS